MKNAELQGKGREAVSCDLAVAAHVRHAETEYDELLAKGTPRWDAREQTRGAASRVLEKWRRRGDA